MFYTGTWPGSIATNLLTLYNLEVRRVLEMMMWINMCVCLPLTILIIYCLFCVTRRSQVPIIYYTNLLISNLIQICIMTLWVTRVESSIFIVIYVSCMMATLYFKMCIALERYFFIACPLLDCLRQTKSSVLVCVLVWALCIISVPLAIVLNEFVRLIIYVTLPGPLFIFCLARTFTALPAATSVPTEEKWRTLGTLIVLFVNYFLIIIPTIICLFVNEYIYRLLYYYVILISVLFLLCPFVDLILFLFMQKGCIDKVLRCLCSCSTDTTVSD
ncbi:taste receptor type 2 member 104-like [Archocentrus centrarchus]|uniref:taste receptor type 2 member 104-like n=1 Tax=Archocentrus centrarchus TaxID=63155 RepID=UPI0011E9DD89|nr:taste receptor type 2 member 104-like [Archocentrus centrarchus]